MQKGRLRTITETEALEIISNRTGRVYYYGVPSTYERSVDAEKFHRSNIYELDIGYGMDYITHELKTAEGVFAIMYKEDKENESI